MQKIIKAQAQAALDKMHDKKVSLADKLASCDGANTLEANAVGHAKTKGVHSNNDAVENKFASADFVMRTYRNISVLHASGYVQQRAATDFDRAKNVVSNKRKQLGDGEAPRDGFYWRQSSELRRAIIELARKERVNAVKQDRADRRAHDDEKLARREEAVQRTLESVVERYAAAKEFYDQWAAQGARTPAQLDEQLQGRSLTDQIGELRRQIEMRTLGLGWTQARRATAACVLAAARRAPPSPTCAHHASPSHSARSSRRSGASTPTRSSSRATSCAGCSWTTSSHTRAPTVG